MSVSVTSDDEEEANEGARHGTLFVGKPHDVAQKGPEAAERCQSEVSAIVRWDVERGRPGEQPDANGNVLRCQQKL